MTADPAPFAGADESTEYTIHRTPDLQVVSPGARVHYACDWKRPGRPPEVAGEDYWGPRDGIRWYTYGARRPNGFFQSQVRQGPLQPHWDLTWDDGPGQYTVIAEIRDRRGDGARSPTTCFRSQQLGDAAALLEDWLGKLLKTGDGPSPAQAEREIARYRGLLDDVAKRLPPPDAAKHRERTEAWAELAARLRGLLAPSDGGRRIPVRAIHLETLTQAQRPLLLFLTELDCQQGNKRWSLVDWTDAGDPRFRGHYEGEGATAHEAIAACLARWDWGNRYPAGHVRFEIPPELSSAVGGAAHRQMRTNGTSLGDEVVAVFEWIAVGSMLLAGFCFIFVAVPTWTSLAMGTSMLASTAGAVFSVAQRWRDGLFDWKADAIDGLTIAGNLVGAGAWARGARVRLPGGRARPIDFVFVGARIGTDAVQGILVAASRVNDLETLVEDRTLQPEERTRKLLALLVELTAVGLMTAVSFRASAREAESLTQKPIHLQNDPRATVPDELLTRLTKPDGPPINAARPPIAEGHSEKPPHKARVVTGIAPAPKVLKPRETDFAKEYAKNSHPWRRYILTEDEIYLRDKDGFEFHAKVTKGALSITIVPLVDPVENPELAEMFGTTRTVKSTVLRARELYPRMYTYFEQVGTEITALQGMWAWTNYTDAKKKYDEVLGPGVTKTHAAKIAVKYARSYVRYHEPMGFTRVVSAWHLDGSQRFTFRFEKE